MSMSLWLRERFGPRVRYAEGSRVRSGSYARYRLQAEPTFTNTVAAAIALARRHLAMTEAKRAVEAMVAGEIVVVDLPMLEDAAAFEAEMRQLGVNATKAISAAAAED